MIARRRHNKPLDTLQVQGLRQYKGKGAKPRGRAHLDGVQWVLLGIAVICLGLVGGRMVEYQHAHEEYAAYQDMAAEAEVYAAIALPDDEIAPPPPAQNKHIMALMAENSDTVAWLDIPGTAIQYPIVQGKDNDHYLTHTFAGKKGAAGAIFMDSYNSGDFSDFNTVIYGHNMKDGSMFATLDSYESQSFLDKHLTIRISTLAESREYRIFAAYTAKGVEDFDFRGFTATTETDRRSFILAARKRADNYSKVTVSVDDHLLTLVTCTDDRQAWYYVVHAVLVAGAPSENNV